MGLLGSISGYRLGAYLKKRLIDIVENSFLKSRDKPEDADEEISKIQWEHFREEYFPEYCEDEEEY